MDDSETNVKVAGRLTLDSGPRTIVIVVPELLLNEDDDEAVDAVPAGVVLFPFKVEDEAADEEPVSVVLGLTSCPPELEVDESESVLNPVASVVAEIVVEKEPVSELLELASDAPPDVKAGDETPVPVTVDDVMFAEVTFGQGPLPVPEGRMYEPVPVALIVLLQSIHGSRIELLGRRESVLNVTVTVVLGNVKVEVVLPLPMFEVSTEVVLEVRVTV